jgi:hypothetical protein
MRSCAPDQQNQGLTASLVSFLERWKIQDVFRRIANDSFFNPDLKNLDFKHLPRISHCLRTPIGGDVHLMLSPGRQAGHYQKLQTCGSAYGCPLCAAKITQYRADEINFAAEKWMSTPGHCMLMITFTLPHYGHQRFKEIRENFMKVRRRFKNHKIEKCSEITPFFLLRNEFNFDHDITAMDFTFSMSNGWHVHSHDLYFCSQTLDDSQIQKLNSQIIDAWVSSCDKCGIQISEKSLRYMFQHSVKVQLAKTPADYIAKFGSEVYERNREMFQGSWGAAEELSKSHLKTGKSNSLTPWDLARIILLCEGDFNVYRYFGRILNDYVEGMRRKQMIFWSKGSKQFFGLLEKSDDEIVKETNDYARLIAVLDKSDWHIILKNKLRGSVAALAGTHNQEQIKIWIRQQIV